MTLPPGPRPFAAEPGEPPSSGGRGAATAMPLVGAVCLALAAGGVATVRGLGGLEWPGCIPFTAGGWTNVLLVLGGGSAAVAGLTAVLRCGPLAAGLLLLVAAAVVAGAAWPLLVTLGCCVSWLIVGDALLRAVKDEAVEGAWVRLLAGGTAMGTVVGLLAHQPINGPALAGLLLLAPAVFAPGSRRRVAAMLGEAMLRLAAPATSGQGLGITLAALGLVHVVAALLPELAHDGLAYQMFVPAHLASRGEWGFDASLYVWAVLPMLGNWLFALGYMLAGEIGARLINCLFVLVLAWLIYECVTWAGGSPRAAAWAAILHLSSPLTFTASSSLFVESVWACLVVGAVLLLLRWASAGGGPGLAATGLLVGGALATKSITLVILPPVALTVLLGWPRAVLGLGLAATLRASLLVLLVGGVPYATAWWLTGNPLFPFYNGVFRSEFFPPTNVIDERWHAGLSWDLPYALTFDSGRYVEGRPGAAGFQWLALLPAATVALAGCRHRRGLGLLVGGIAAFAAVFVLSSYLRYVYPAACLLNAAVPVGLFLLPRAWQPLVSGLLGLVVLLNCGFLNAGPNGYDDFPLQTLLSPRHREAYLADRVPMRKVVAVVNEHNVEGSPVAVLGPPLAAGLAADALYADWYNQRFADAVAAAADTDALAAALREHGAVFVILDDQWDSPLKRAMVELVTEPIFSHRGVALRRIREVYRFPSELLSSPRFTDGSAGWTQVPCVGRTAAGELIVSEPCHAHQTVPVGPDLRYRLAVTARSADRPAQGRLQVVWLDASGQPLRADIEVFSCAATPEEHVAVVTAPAGTAAAQVYACGHTTDAIIVTEVSFRR